VKLNLKTLAVILMLFCAAGIASAQTTYTVYIHGAGVHPGSDKAQAQPIETLFAQALGRELNSQPYVSSVTLITPDTHYPEETAYVVLNVFAEPINNHTYVVNTVILTHAVNDTGSFRYHGTAVSIVDLNLVGGVGSAEDPEVPVSLIAAVQHARLFFERQAGMPSR